MKKSKRFLSLALVLALAMGLTLTACGDTGGTPSAAPTDPPKETQQQTQPGTEATDPPRRFRLGAHPAHQHHQLRGLRRRHGRGHP